MITRGIERNLSSVLVMLLGAVLLAPVTCIAVVPTNIALDDAEEMGSDST